MDTKILAFFFLGVVAALVYPKGANGLPKCSELDVVCEFNDDYYDCMDQDCTDACEPGELPLDKTMKCQKNGYTCVTGVDGHLCCEDRYPETRDCIPCDETYLKKPEDAEYVTPGTCGYKTADDRAFPVPGSRDENDDSEHGPDDGHDHDLNWFQCLMFQRAKSEDRTLK